MATKYLEKYASTAALIANAPDRSNAAGIGVVSGAPYLNVAGSAAPIALALTAGLKVVAGQATTVTASDTIATGLALVVAVVAGFDSDPVDDPLYVSASIGDQAGSPDAGSFILNTWKDTSGSDPTPVAASTFSKKINWIAIGS
jgi:hypothetical protein